MGSLTRVRIGFEDPLLTAVDGPTGGGLEARCRLVPWLTLPWSGPTYQRRAARMLI